MARKIKTSIEGALLTFAILATDGETVAQTFELDASKLSKEMQQNALMHGIKQKVGDSAAGADNPESAAARIEATIKQLVEGTWVAQREGGGASRSTQLAKAVAQMKGLDLKDVEAKLATMSDEQVDALRKHPQVKAVMAQLRAEAAAAKAKDAAEAEGEEALAALG